MHYELDPQCCLPGSAPWMAPSHAQVYERRRLRAQIALGVRRRARVGAQRYVAGISSALLNTTLNARQ